MSTSLIGKTLGKIQIKQLLGRGGMATVYQGYQADIDRFVAVKVLAQIPEMDQAFIDRFKLEARTIARLQHPHILPIYDYGEEHGVLYLVTAYVSGGSLADLIAQGPLPLPTISRILREVGSALDYAHRQGIIHRDIKPGNILLDKEGFALLADFGIVKLLEGHTTANLTATSGVVGTPAYMAPEQANGAPVDSRTDIYALGIVTYEMITGRQPFAAETPVQLLIKHLTEPPPRLSDHDGALPPGLDAVLQRVMAKDPDTRYQTATALADAFAQAVSSTESVGSTRILSDNVPTSLDAKPVTVGTPQTPPTTNVSVPNTSRLQMIVTIGVALAAVLALLLAVIALMTTNQRETALTPSSAAAATSAPAQAASTPTALPTQPRFGLASFATTNAVGDTLNLRVENLAPPPAGTSYYAWLENSQDETFLPLGALNLDPLGAVVLTYTNTEGLALPGLYNRILITAEADAGDAPTNPAVYSGSVPLTVTSALREILWGSEQGINGGSLLDGALTEARISVQHSGLAARATNLAGLHQHAEHTINILLGTNDDLDGDGRPANPGRGIGVVFFLDLIEARLNDAASDPDAGSDVQTQIEYIRVCLVNARTRLDEGLALERLLLAAGEIAEVETERNRSTEVLSQMIDGLDLNENGAVELFEGECGLAQVADSGILIGNLALRAADAS